jgi:hypothetical protein
VKNTRGASGVVIKPYTESMQIEPIIIKNEYTLSISGLLSSTIFQVSIIVRRCNIIVMNRIPRLPLNNRELIFINKATMGG